jgi:hypothetical protein
MKGGMTVARINVLGGEIPAGKWDTKFLFIEVFPEVVTNVGSEYRKLDLNTIKSAEMVDQEQIKSIVNEQSNNKKLKFTLLQNTNLG